MHFRENFMRVDIFLQELRYEEIRQQKAYDVIKLLGIHIKYICLSNSSLARKIQEIQCKQDQCRGSYLPLCIKQKWQCDLETELKPKSH